MSADGKENCQSDDITEHTMHVAWFAISGILFPPQKCKCQLYIFIHCLTMYDLFVSDYLQNQLVSLSTSKQTV